jgi:hypothetical protein
MEGGLGHGGGATKAILRMKSKGVTSHDKSVVERIFEKHNI